MKELQLSSLIPVQNIGMPWVIGASIAVSLIFCAVLYPTSRSRSKRYGIIGAPIGGLIVTCGFSAVRGHGMRDSLIFFIDVMLCCTVAAFVVVRMERKYGQNKHVDAEKWVKFGRVLGLALLILAGFLLFLEFGPGG